ncbi:MAG: helix-turn-helix domain-containing protein [Pseudonocardiaceae bacterium]
MTEPTIGERIRELRRPLYTQVDLAVAADVSVDVIRKLEQGRRLTASITTLQRIARVLGVGVADLLGRARPAAAGQGQARVEAIRDALTPIDDLIGAFDGGEVPTVAMFARSVTYGWGTHWGGRYGLLAAMLPDLLAQSRAVLRDCATADQARAVDLAAQVRHLTARTLLHLGAADLAHTAVRESLRLTARGDDPLRDAAMRTTLTHVLIRQGRFVDAEQLATVSAAQIQPAGNTTTAQLSVYGGLLLRGATAAARQRRAGAAADLLTEAAAVAERTGVDRTHYEVLFGPSNVVAQSADIAVVTEDYVAAVEVARRMPRGSTLPLAAQSRHLADVAHAQLRLGNIQAAESALLTMEQSAPEWAAHHHQLPRILVRELLTLRRPSSRLRALAERLDVRPDTSR